MVAVDYYDRLFNFVFQYGLQKTQEQGQQVTDDAFLCNVHEGYYLAQDQILEALTTNQNERRSIPKRNRKQLAANKYSDAVIRSFANSVAWIMLRGEKHIIRRLNDGTPPVPILSANIDDTLAFISSRRSDLHSFYLITDTTSCIKHGDLLSIHFDEQPRIELLELKSGRVNHQILATLDQPVESGAPDLKADGIHSKAAVDQEERIRRQQDRMRKALRNINEGAGPYAITGDNYHLIDERVFLEEYTTRLVKLIQGVHKKGWAIDVIDECLYLGCYLNGGFGTGAFQAWLQGMDIETELIDLRTSVYAPGTMPLLMHPELCPFVKSIFTGEISVFMALDQKKLVQQMAERGLDARLLTKKQSMNLNKSTSEAYRQHRLQGRSIQISNDSELEFTLTDGFYERIFYDLVYPSECVRLEQFVVDAAKRGKPAF